MEFRSIWHISADETVIKTFSSKESTEGKLLVKSLFSMISSGTERNVALGNVPQDLYEHMRIPNMKGSFDFPLNHGYSLVGEVIKGPPYFKGKLVHLLHPHQDHAEVLPEEAHIVPEGIEPSIAALASNMETVINAIWDSEISLGDNVLITGFGSVGAMLAITLHICMPGVSVYALELSERRVNAGRSLGIQMVEEKELSELSFDVAFDTSGNDKGLQTCIDQVGYEGKIVALSWFGVNHTSLNLGGEFHPMRKKIISSQVSNIPLHKSGSWDFNRRKNLVFKVLKNQFWQRIPLRLIPFQDAPDFFNSLRKKEIDSIFNLIKYK